MVGEFDGKLGDEWMMNVNVLNGYGHATSFAMTEMK
jgi:hypothetical protein